MIAVGPRPAGIRPRGRDRRHADRQQPPRSRSDEHESAYRADRETRERRAFDGTRRSEPGAHKTGWTDAIGVGAANAVGIIIGEVDADLHGQCQHQCRCRFPPHDRVNRGRYPCSGRYWRDSGRERAQACALDPIGNAGLGGHDVILCHPVTVRSQGRESSCRRGWPWSNVNRQSIIDVTDCMAETREVAMHDKPDMALLLAEAIAKADPGLSQRLESDPQAHLEMVQLTSIADTEATNLLRAAVTSARAAGFSWEAIGGALGMTRQAAQQRFAIKSEPVESSAERHRLVGLNATSEIDTLNEWGRYGWHSVAFGS